MIFTSVLHEYRSSFSSAFYESYKQLKLDFLSALFSVFTANITGSIEVNTRDGRNVWDTSQLSNPSPNCPKSQHGKTDVKSKVELLSDFITSNTVHETSVMHSLFLPPVLSRLFCKYRYWLQRFDLIFLFRLQAGEIIDKEGKVYSLCCLQSLLSNVSAICLVLVLSSHGFFRVQVNLY